MPKRPMGLYRLFSTKVRDLQGVMNKIYINNINVNNDNKCNND